MIHVIATVEVAEGRRDDFLDRFGRVVPLVRAETGCLEYGPAIDAATDIAAQQPVRNNVVVVVEQWESLEALNDHLVAPHMAEYRTSVKDLVVSTSLRVLEPLDVS